MTPKSHGRGEHDVSRGHQRPCPSECHRYASKEDLPAQRNKREVLDRSRAGLGANACVITDAIGRAVAFVLAPGQAHELPHAMPVLDRMPGVPKWVVAYRGYSRHAVREHIWRLGTRPVGFPIKKQQTWK